MLQSSNHSSSSIGLSATAACKPLKHLTKLPLDLQQLQQLLHWAVFGPSCSSSCTWNSSKQALQAQLTAERLGVRETRIAGAAGFSQVQVLGGCIADVAEDGARQLLVLQRARRQQMRLVGLGIEVTAGGCSSEGGVREECEGETVKETAVAADQQAAAAKADLSSSGSDSSSSSFASSDGCAAAEAADVGRCNAVGDGGYAEAAAAAHVDGGCVLPLGLSLSSDELWGLLVPRMQS